MCIIRQLIHQHSIIDSYPMMMTAVADRGRGASSSFSANDTEPPPDMSDSSDEASASSVDLPDDDENALAKNPSMILSEKIAQDVLIFKKIAERLPPTSLLHLLKADVLVKVDASTAAGEDAVPIIEAKAPVEKQHLDEQTTATENDTTKHSHKVLAPFRATKVRFATNGQGKLACDTHCYEPVRDKTLWWRREEMDQIRAACTGIVENYSLFYREYDQNVANMMEYANEATILERDDQEVKFFELHEAARGLERHIVVDIMAAKQLHFEAVMDAQMESQQARTTERWKYIKKVSLEHSLTTRFLAVRFALTDQAGVERNDTKPTTSAKSAGDAVDSCKDAETQLRSSVSSRRGLSNLLQRTVNRRYTAS